MENTNNDCKEICTLCGMVANLDPWLHEERYGHRPEIVRDGIPMIHDFNRTGVFVPVRA